MTLRDLKWLSKIFNDTKRRAVSLRQLSFLLVTCHVKANLAGTANVALCPTGKHSKRRPCPTDRRSKPRSTPHCQARQTSPCAALSVMMPQFIRRMRYSDTAMQLCYALRYHAFLMQFGLRRAAAFLSSPIHFQRRACGVGDETTQYKYKYKYK